VRLGPHRILRVQLPVQMEIHQLPDRGAVVHRDPVRRVEECDGTVPVNGRRSSSRGNEADRSPLRPRRVRARGDGGGSGGRRRPSSP
jgi:hypothetical protein